MIETNAKGKRIKGKSMGGSKLNVNRISVPCSQTNNKDKKRADRSHVRDGLERKIFCIGMRDRKADSFLHPEQPPRVTGELRTALEQFPGLPDYVPVENNLLRGSDISREMSPAYARLKGLHEGLHGNRSIDLVSKNNASALDIGSEMITQIDEGLVLEIAQHDHVRQLFPDGSGAVHEQILNNIWALYLDNIQDGNIALSDLAFRNVSDGGRSVLREDFAPHPRGRVIEPGILQDEGELYSLLNAISDTLLLVSPKFELLWTNHAGVHEFNGETSGGVWQYCRKMLLEGAVSSNGCLAQKCFDSNQRIIETVIHDDMVLELKAFPISNGDLTDSVLLWVSDVTEKMTLEAERIQAGNLAAVGEWAAGVAHEINNPITGIINYGQILINECASGSLEKDLGERIVKEGERVGRIVNNLLSYARNRQKEKSPVQISAILEETVILTQTKIRRDGILLKVDLPDDLPEVEVNFQEIQQVFINVITNARHALNEKYERRHDNKRLEIRAEQIRVHDRPHVRIEFLDHGVGIAPENLERVTKPFFTTKPSGKGTGLGLSITTKIIADHGGRLCFESTEGEYTRTIIDLPSQMA